MKKKIIGYARVSSKGQCLDLQIQQLQEYAEKNGCEIEIFSEIRNAKEVMLLNDFSDTGEYHKYVHLGVLGNAIGRARELNAPLVVTYLDRLSRSENNGMAIYNDVAIISVFERIDRVEDVRAIFQRAEAENKLRSIKTKNALAQCKSNLKSNSIECYRNVYEEKGAPEFVVEYVLGEMNNPKRHLHVAIWDEADVFPAIMMAWDDVGITGLDSSIEEVAEVAEVAIYNLSHVRQIRLAKELGYYN